MAIQFNNGQIVNGKRINLPSSATASDIVRASGRPADLGSRAVVRVGARGNERLKPGMSYAIRPGDKFLVGPDRVKGSEAAYFGEKNEKTKKLIMEQAKDLSETLPEGSKIVLDEECHWAVVEELALPGAWAENNPEHQKVKMMLIFPDQFPELPTNGFYLPDFIQPPAGFRYYARPGSGAADAIDKPSTSAGWRWYGTVIKPESWHPDYDDWRSSSNLRDIFELCCNALSE